MRTAPGLLKTIITYLFICLLIAWNLNCLGQQDTLVLRAGNRVASHILEVSGSEISYKKADYPDGPVYTLRRISLP